MILSGILKNNKMVNRGKASRELFIFNIFGVYVSLVYSYFNVEEIYGVKYGFEISSEPVLLKEVSFQTFLLRQWSNATLFLWLESGHLAPAARNKKLSQDFIFCSFSFLMCKIETFNSNFDVDHRFLISFFIDLHHFKLTQYSFDFLFNLENFVIFLRFV